jgi:chaperonin GroES
MQNESGFVPTGDLLVVRLRKVEEKTAGGIVLPGSVTDKHQLAETTGEVVAMGQTASAHPRMHGIIVGDSVLFPRYSGHHFPVDGVDYWIMEARSVLGKAEKLPDYLLKGAESSKEVFGANEPTIKNGMLAA